VEVEFEFFYEDVKGTGHWKINNSLFDDNNYQEALKSGIAKWKEEALDARLDKRMTWDYLKYKIRQLSIQFSKEKKHKLLEKERNLMKRISDMENNLEMEDIVTYESMKHELNSIRSYYEEGERSTKYFLNLKSD